MSGIICDNEGKMMKINKDVLKSLNPCDNRYKHFLEHHGEFSGSLNDFLDLPNLEYVDKIWIARRVLTKNQAVKWATLCAESVVHIFEKEYPDNQSLSDCISYLKTVKDFDNLTNDQASEIKRHEEASRAACFVAAGGPYAVSLTAYCSRAPYAAGAADAVGAAVRAAVREAAYATLAAYDIDVDVADTECYAVQAAFYATTDASDSNKIAAQESQEALNIKFLKQVIN